MKSSSASEKGMMDGEQLTGCLCCRVSPSPGAARSQADHTNHPSARHASQAARAACACCTAGCR